MTGRVELIAWKQAVQIMESRPYVWNSDLAREIKMPLATVIQFKELFKKIKAPKNGN